GLQDVVIVPGLTVGGHRHRAVAPDLLLLLHRRHKRNRLSRRYGLGPYCRRPEPKMGANTRATTAISLMRMFRDGPAVSFRGSPTVSPTTAAAWASVPLPP